MTQNSGWFSRLKQGLRQSSQKLTSGITTLFTHRRLDAAALEDLEDLLLMADLGVTATQKIIADLSRDKFDKEVTPEEVKEHLAQSMAAILEPVARPLVLTDAKPHVVLVVGVNGSGKTTTIAKLAKQWTDQGLQVAAAAGDTFRAAAVEQLKVWGQRLNMPVESRPIGADAAALAFDAYEKSRARGDDVLLIDTAGRLHNNQNLMAELEKIRKVLEKIDGAAPHTCLQVLDATIGQNTHAQVDIFRKIAHVDGLIMTKLDGSAKGGVVVSLAEKFQLPIYALGVGEGSDDLKPFTPNEFACSLLDMRDA